MTPLSLSRERPLIPLTRPDTTDETAVVIAGFYRSFDSFGFGFVEPVYRRVLAVELRHAGLNIQTEVPFELFHLGEPVGRYRADLIVEKHLIVEVKTGPALDP